MTGKELRELDAFIAEHVMGYEWWLFHGKPPSKDKWCTLCKPGTWQPGQGGLHVDYPHKDDEKDFGCVPRYTTDPAEAFLVLDLCQQKTSVIISRNRVWEQKIGGKSAEAETLALAICLFARKVLEK